MSPRHALRPASLPRHSNRPSAFSVGRAIALVLTAVLTFTVSAGAFGLADLQGNIDAQDVTDRLGTDRPIPQPPADPNAGHPLNVLLIGSDERDGENATIGGAVADGMRSDTTILMHISADRKRVDLVSIPRDSWVEIPSCTLSDGTTTPPQTNKFNTAFATGGRTGDVGDAAACTIRTVEQLTGVYIHEYAVVDFTGFIAMVDALGGVPMCIPNYIYAPKANNLELQPGQQTLDGRDALGYARARTGIGLGDGSDTARIQRQQQLLGATVRRVMSSNLLTDGPALYRFLDAATSSLTTSPDLASIPNLVGLANSLRGLSAKNVTFHTVPWAPRGDGANVVWTPEAADLFAALAADEPVVIDEPEDAPADDGTSPDPSGQDPGGTDEPTTSPSTPTTPSEPAATPSAKPSPSWDIMRADEHVDACG